jgi:hypothetical protein
MEWIRGLLRLLLMLVRRKQFESDLEEEMRLHRELRESRNRSSAGCHRQKLTTPRSDASATT